MRAKAGEHQVLEELDARGWLLRGEGSGHLLALDKHSTCDGIVSALQIFNAKRRRGRGLPELFGGVTPYPRTWLNARLGAGVD